MVELLDLSGVPLGWAHLHHLDDAQPRMSLVKELFVWPRVRHLGYGRLLEDFTAVQARNWGSERLCVLFHEADDYPSNVTTAKAFATIAGYKWQWTFQQRPNVPAVAEKSL
jgi:GNAT superfamily N-acetyltransferase